MFDKSTKRSNQAVHVYLLLGGLFIAFLVVCNLIANKFISVQTIFRDAPFIISAGVLPYPITLLIIVVLKLGGVFNAIEGSPVSDATYDIVFGNSWRVIGASMTAYLFAQFIDVQLYDFWKKLTNGRMLWLRNNGSTVLSQLADTILVVSVLFIGIKTGEEITSMIMDGWLFKVICALIDTPILYVSVFLLRKYFKLRPGEEVEF